MKYSNKYADHKTREPYVHYSIKDSRRQSPSFESFDLEEYTQEEEDSERRDRLRIAFRATASEARAIKAEFERHEEFERLLRKGLSEVQASYAVYGSRYAHRLAFYDSWTTSCDVF